MAELRLQKFVQTKNQVASSILKTVTCGWLRGKIDDVESSVTCE